MRILTYAKHQGEAVLELVERIVPEKHIEVCQTIEHLSDSLRRPAEKKEMLVLLAPATRQELQEIVSIQPLLENYPIIVIAPDQEGETVAMAHLLRPRFLTYSGEDPWALVAVMRKIMDRQEHGREGADSSA